nr:tRNA pseudouridine(38/39) synthase isoform X1 [Tanacetum cinerariifolium]
MDNQSDVITELRSKLSSFETRIKELEAENSKLTSIISNCSCHKEKTLDIDLLENNMFYGFASEAQMDPTVEVCL